MMRLSMGDYQSYFRGKKVTVMRVGIIGRGIGDTAYMAEAGAEIRVVDDAPQSVMQPAVDALAKYPNITFSFGPYENRDFENRDFVLVGAGARLDLPCLVHARAVGTRLVQSAALFAELTGIPIIGVTGTRGKSTVTHMIHHALSLATGETVLLGGNVRGVSNLQLLKDVTPDSLCVMELDSWQLQGFGWAGISPHVAVFTNFMEDHLNYYAAGGKSHDEAMEAYFADKAQIFLHQNESGVLVTTPQVFERARAFAQGKNITLGQEVVLVDASTLPDDVLLRVPGDHNRENAALALEALKATGLTEEEALTGLVSFTGVEGRLQYLSEHDGVKIFNDNNATTPQATQVGIKAVARGKNVILIAGGAYKEVDPSLLVEPIQAHCKKVVLLAGTGTDILKEKIECDVVDSLAVAVKNGLRAAESGDVLLFSPGFASFGMFKNEYDRNDQFVKIIQSYEHETH
jgi:UDP-N-acetylmuramoylalanine--D-glutamate ligase